MSSKKIGRPKAINPKNIEIKVRIDEKLKKKILLYCNEQNIVRAELIRNSIEFFLFQKNKK